MQSLRFATLCCSLIGFAAFDANAQSLDSLRTIDMANLRAQSYLPTASGVDCDSTTGTTLEQRICANLKLQRQDSLLQSRIALIVKDLEESGRENALASFLLGQKLWERYRYAHCSTVVFEEDMSAIDMILFMECAAEVTETRRREVEGLMTE